MKEDQFRNKSVDFKMSPGLLWSWLFLYNWLSWQFGWACVYTSGFLNWAAVNGGEKELKEEDEEGRGDGEAARAAWGLLGPTEGIVICNIHSNVPYQMQWVRRCSRMEISLVPHSALVMPRANSDKWIYSDNTYGTLTIQKVAWMTETVEGCEAAGFKPQCAIQPALHLFS